MKDKLGGKITTEFIGLWPKTYSYLIDDGNNNKKVKGTRECVTKAYVWRLWKCSQNNEI